MRKLFLNLNFILSTFFWSVLLFGWLSIFGQSCAQKDMVSSKNRPASTLNNGDDTAGNAEITENPGEAGEAFSIETSEDGRQTQTVIEEVKQVFSSCKLITQPFRRDDTENLNGGLWKTKNISCPENFVLVSISVFPSCHAFGAYQRIEPTSSLEEAPTSGQCFNLFLADRTDLDQPTKDDFTEHCDGKGVGEQTHEIATCLAVCCGL